MLKTLLCSKDMLGPCEGNYAPPFGAKHCAGFSGYGTVRPDMKHFTNNIYVKNNTQYKVRIGCKAEISKERMDITLKTHVFVYDHVVDVAKIRGL